MDAAARFGGFEVTLATSAGAATIPMATTSTFIGVIAASSSFATITINSNFSGSASYDNITAVQ